MNRNPLLILLSIMTVFLCDLNAIYAQQTCVDTCDRPGLSYEEIDATDVTSPQRLKVDPQLLRDRWYMAAEGTLHVHDAPNGQVVRVVETGFNFVTATEKQDDWIRISPGEWVHSESLRDVTADVSHFSGFRLTQETQGITFAWSLVNMYPSRNPGGDPSEDFDLIYRYTLLNIYATEEVDGHRWYQIGAEQWVHQYRVAKILPISRPETVTTERWISIDLYEQTLIAYEDENPVFATLVSTGLDRWPTYEGTFSIYYRTQREFMSWGTVGDDFYALEEVPWTMYFDQGRALHGAYWHDGFGYRRSHGCVNLSITDAYWLYGWVAEAMGSRASSDIEDGPNVYVYSSDEYR